MKKDIQANIWKLYAGRVLNELLFLAAIIVPFLGSLGLTMQQILITEVVFSAAIVLLEIPSGYFADRVGRKTSMILGAFFWVAGTTFYAFSYEFIGFAIGACLWGFGTSFTSGANEALLYESLIQLKREKEYKKIQGNIFFYGRMSSVVASIAAGFMAVAFLRLPIYASVFPFIIWFFISLTLKETKHQNEQLETWPHFKKIFQESFVHNRKLRYFIIYAAITGFFAIEFWLAQRYWGFLEVPIFYFGIIVAGMGISSGLLSKFAKEIEEKVGEKLSLILISVIPIITWLIFGSFNLIWIVPLFLITSGIRGYCVPVFNTYVQNHTSSDRRATIMSVMNFLRKGVFFIFAPLLGWVADIYSIQTTFLYIAGITIVFSLIFLSFLRKEKVI
jgi:MFS family permease